MKRSPQGLFKYEPLSSFASESDLVEAYIADGEAWAKQILERAKPKVIAEPGQEIKMANARLKADPVFGALVTLHQVRAIRKCLSAAESNGHGAVATRVAFHMAQFLFAAFQSTLVAGERVLRAGVGVREGGRKGAIAHWGETNIEARDENARKMVKAEIASGKRRMDAYRSVAGRLGCKVTTVRNAVKNSE